MLYRKGFGLVTGSFRETGAATSAHLRLALEELEHLGLVDARKCARRQCGEEGRLNAGTGPAGVAPLRDQLRGRLAAHEGSGQRDTARCGVPRPRNHFTCSYGVPTETE